MLMSLAMLMSLVLPQRRWLWLCLVCTPRTALPCVISELHCLTIQPTGTAFATAAVELLSGTMSIHEIDSLQLLHHHSAMCLIALAAAL
jgi:hypothetical protein